jgi:hypothetical protein
MTTVTTTRTQEVKLSNDVTFGLSKHDWQNLKRNISRIKSPPKFLSNIYSTIFGVSISAFFAYLALPDVSSPWIKSLFLISSIAAFILSIVLFIVEKSVLKTTEIQASDILEDMAEIEKLYQG